MNLFRAANNATVNIAVSASTQRVQVTNQNGRLQVAVANPGTATVFIAFGDSTITASTTASMPILAGSVRGFTVDAPDGGALYAAAIGTSGSIYFTPGTGI
jgi:hypothetical protein